MKTNNPMSSLSMWLFQKFFPVVVLLIGLGFSAGLIVLGERSGLHFLSVLGAISALISFLLALFTAREIVERMKEDASVTLADATLTTWFRYLLLLSFVPIIGPVAERWSTRRKVQNPFVVDEDRDREA